MNYNNRSYEDDYSLLCFHNLSTRTTKEDLERDIEKKGFRVSKIVMKIGFALIYVEGRNYSAAVIKEFNGLKLDGRRLRVEKANRLKFHREEYHKPSRTLYVGRLDWSSDPIIVQKDLTKFFGAYGTISSIEIVENDYIRRRWAYVTFEDLSEAVDAFDALANRIIKGLNWRVEFSIFHPLHEHPIRYRSPSRERRRRSRSRSPSHRRRSRSRSRKRSSRRSPDRRKERYSPYRRDRSLSRERHRQSRSRSRNSRRRRSRSSSPYRRYRSGRQDQPQNNNLVENNTNFIEHLPLDISMNILGRLSPKDRINLLSVSRQMNEIVRDVVSKGQKSSLDAIIIGLPQAGSTTLFWRLANQNTANNRVLNQNNLSNEDDIDTSKQGMHFLRRISLGGGGRTAILFHGSSKHTTRKRMYHYYGLTQCMIIVIPAQVGSDVASFKRQMKQVLLPAFALCGHMNWIFAVNKMELMEYSEAAYNEVVAITTEVCNKISQQITNTISFIPISAQQSQHLFQKTMDDDDNMAWYKGPSIIEKMNEISFTVPLPLYKFASKKSSIAIIRYKRLNYTPRMLLHFDKKIVCRVQGYVTSGVIDKNDTLYLSPQYYLAESSDKYTGALDRIPFTITSIKHFDAKLKAAVAGTFVGLTLEFENDKYQRYIHPKYLGLQDHLITPHYHHLSKEIEVKRSRSVRKKHEKFARSIEADVVVVASKSGTWDGHLQANLTAGFFSYLARGHCKVTKVELSSTAVLDPSENGHVAKKGQRARIKVEFDFPLRLVEHRNTPSGEGRIALVMHDQVIAIGLITAVCMP